MSKPVRVGIGVNKDDGKRAYWPLLDRGVGLIGVIVGAEGTWKSRIVEEIAAGAKRAGMRTWYADIRNGASSPALGDGSDRFYSQGDLAQLAVVDRLTACPRGQATLLVVDDAYLAFMDHRWHELAVRIYKTAGRSNVAVVLVSESVDVFALDPAKSLGSLQCFETILLTRQVEKWHPVLAHLWGVHDTHELPAMHGVLVVDNLRTNRVVLGRQKVAV